MAPDIETDSVPLNYLSQKSRYLLTCLLNTKKVLPSDGPAKLPRDWRGLASLVNISSEIASEIDNHQDKVAKVLELWILKKDGTAIIRYLYEYLQRLDRYDVYDDLKDLESKSELIDPQQNIPKPGKHIPSIDDVRDDLITYDDVKYGEPQLYHAYVLYAREDKDFVDELLCRMRENGFKLCTEDDLQPGHSTQYAPVSRLISERCHRIILVYSPDFLSSPANSFYMNYAQAVSIELKKPKIIPCMYRSCQLPANLSYYHKLYYAPPGHKAAYNFWDKLGQSLELANLPRLPSENTTQSSLRITEYKPITNSYYTTSEQTDFLALPAPLSTTSSLSTKSLNTLQVKLQTDDTKSLSNISNLTETKLKVKNPIRRLLNTIKGKSKKEKKAIMVEN